MRSPSAQRPLLSTRIESLRARGVKNKHIAERLGCSLSYVDKVISWSVQPAPEHGIDLDAQHDHVEAVLAVGGYPTAAVIAGRTFHLNHRGHLWSPRPAWRADV